MRRSRVLSACGLALVCGVLGWNEAGAQSGDLPVGVAPAGAGTSPPQETMYAVTPEVGLWLICAASYAGPDAPDLAQQLVLDIRNRHHLPAYVFNRGAEERRQQQEEFEQLKKQHPGVPLRRRTVRIQEQCAVLLGGYPDMDRASAALKEVRKLPMPELKLSGDRLPYDTMLVGRPDPERKQTAVQRIPINPFSTAFVVRNPSVPLTPKPVPKVDPFWKELNSDEEYSLLKCHKTWTLAVKEYQGASVVQPRTASSSFLRMLGLGSQKPGEGLNAAALQAHELARVLRNPGLGFDAYVLHTRTASIVTVGAFDAPNDPELLRVQQRLAALKFANDKRQDPVGLFAQPMPMEVPHP